MSKDPLCTSVDDCLDKKDFEAARKYCAKEEFACDKVKIIELESQFWIDESEFIRAKKIALEIYSIEEKSKAEKNNFFAEKLNDIIAKATMEGKIDEGIMVYADFPLDVKGDRTIVYQVDAAKTIAEALKQVNRKNEAIDFREKQLKAQKKLNELKLMYKKEKEQKIKGLNNDIGRLRAELKSKKKATKHQLIDLKKERRKALKRLEDIQKGFYVFSSRREADISDQNRIIGNIEYDIQKIEGLEDQYNQEIENIKNEIKSVKSENIYEY